MNKTVNLPHADDDFQFISYNRECLSYVIERLFRPYENCPNPGGVCSRIEDTIHFLSRNLKREEKLMIDVGYPEIAVHKQEHDKILDKLEKMKRNFICGSYENSLVSAILVKWAKAHAESLDKPFDEFLLEHKRCNHQ